ncbi:MAG: glycosyltransferase family 2 protein [Verrucomicrobiota bacterium]
MNREEVTPLILTWNEAPNIGRCLDRLHWASEVVILDSGSNDETESIAGEYSNVRFETRPFDTHAKQWNHGSSLVSTPWVLALDADYLVEETFPEELDHLETAGVLGFRSHFQYCVEGRPLRATLYPPKTVLFRKDSSHFVQDGHTQLLVDTGEAPFLRSVIQHDDRKSLDRWLDSQRKYARLEAEKLSESEPSSLRLPDRIRRAIWPAAPLTFIYTLFAKGVIRDGWRGLFYALQRTYAELLLSLYILGGKLCPSPKSHHGNNPKTEDSSLPLDRADRVNSRDRSHHTSLAHSRVRSVERDRSPQTSSVPED